MPTMRILFSALAFLLVGCQTTPFLVIAHRGASGSRPEHTLESYKLAIEMGADCIEPDLVMTKDGVLIARHENELSDTTNVAEVFPSRKTKKMIDGQEVRGFFSEDLTLSEIQKLRTKERLPIRNQSFNGQFKVPAFSEVLELVRAESAARGREICIYPETKHSAYFRGIGLPIEEPLIAELTKFGFNRPNAPIYIQSFESDNLKELRKTTDFKLVQLIDEPMSQRLIEGDADLVAIHQYASGIGPHKGLVLAGGKGFVERVQKFGLVIHPWTHRAEPEFVLPPFKGDADAEFRALYETGIDGIFSDNPEKVLRLLNRGRTPASASEEGKRFRTGRFESI